MITLDGSQGEGGGQILRSALALSLVTGRPFRIERIRARRPKPGLMRQHLACVDAAARIGSAAVDGAALGSMALTFQPGPIGPGAHEFKIGSAGSTMLLLQTILPPLLLADGPSEIVLEGGTHNPFAPPFPFIQAAFLPLLRRMGFRVDATLERAGFYPNGGGRCRVRIEPVERRSPTRPDAADTTTCVGSETGAPGLRPLELPARSRRGDEAEQVEDIRLLTSAATATVCLVGLPRSIAERELAVLERQLGVTRARCKVDACSGALGPGNSVHLHVPLDGYAEVFSGFGSVKVSSEQVARAMVADAEPFLRNGAAVGEHLADQLLLPMALGAGGRFTTTEPSGHTRTNIEVIREFLKTEITMTPVDEGLWEIEVNPR